MVEAVWPAGGSLGSAGSTGAATPPASGEGFVGAALAASVRRETQPLRPATTMPRLAAASARWLVRLADAIDLSVRDEPQVGC
jgi:hypothetical protein